MIHTKLQNYLHAPMCCLHVQGDICIPLKAERISLLELHGMYNVQLESQKLETWKTTWEILTAILY